MNSLLNELHRRNPSSQYFIEKHQTYTNIAILQQIQARWHVTYDRKYHRLNFYQSDVKAPNRHWALTNKDFSHPFLMLR